MREILIQYIYCVPILFHPILSCSIPSPQMHSRTHPSIHRHAYVHVHRTIHHIPIDSRFRTPPSPIISNSAYVRWVRFWREYTHSFAEMFEGCMADSERLSLSAVKDLLVVGRVGNEMVWGFDFFCVSGAFRRIRDRLSKMIPLDFMLLWGGERRHAPQPPTRKTHQTRMFNVLTRTHHHPSWLFSIDLLLC